MTKNSKINKKGILSPVRVGGEREKKLRTMCEKSGKSLSSGLRELIDKGKIEVITNGKELVRDVAELQNKINQYSLKMSNDIQGVKSDIHNSFTYSAFRYAI